MDIASFAVGFALGRRKGGGGGYRDRVFHNIVDNHLTVYDYTLNSTYKWRIGLWLSDVENYMGTPEPFENGMYTGYVVSQGNASMHLNRMSRYLYIVGIVYKNNSPIWASIIYELSNFADDYGTWSVGNDGYIYKQVGDWALDEVSNVVETSFAPDISSGSTRTWYGYFSGNISFTYRYSYQTYIADDGGSGGIPTIRKNGVRTSSTSNYNLYGHYAYPLPRLYGGFSDLNYSDWIDEMQNVAYAVYEHENVPTVPLEILEPVD